MTIRHLSETVINQIAAGEVIERPASVVKELIENSIDAGATRIDIATAGGGKTLIRISDNGSGIAADQLELAISRHCTSKLNDDVHDIRSLGFRGEALPSIGSVAKLKITSRTQNNDNATEIAVNAGHIDGPRPAAGNYGTIVEVRDLFYVTPARLKFMKSDRAETAAITDIVKRIAIAFPHIRFSVSGSDRNLLDFPATGKDRHAQLERIAQIMGKDFAPNCIPLDVMRENISLTGFSGVPSFNRGNSLHQFAYVNGRPVRDKLLLGAIRAAYFDSIARDRYGVCVLFIDLPHTDVDVNVHPAKADVRFRDPGLVRGLIVGGIREALSHAGIRPASTGADAMLAAFLSQVQKNTSDTTYTAQSFSTDLSFQDDKIRDHKIYSHIYNQSVYKPPNHSKTTLDAAQFGNAPLKPYRHNSFHENETMKLDALDMPIGDISASLSDPTQEELGYPLGAARAQIHKNYIVSQTQDSLIIVDQHAAHERLVYEALKNALYSRPLPSQMLLIPEIVELSSDDMEGLLSHQDTLKKFGLVIEPFGPGALAVRETPSMLGEVNAKALILDLADEVAEHDTADGLKAMLDYVAATMACHGSVRSGRILKGQEMNALLRQMEAVPSSGTCNHGRPTYIELKLHDIERLFGRR
ncbi:DNA mismatch repair endonuclease MutL [Bartonella tamiae]|uniref:DNA mismatch repair protein MutL n=1 Tax=Bartonella tamiae Th239 TaxID=1094558 RepID=J1K151_9HYPH|nr:DNA mismatch repair endonuclease MutL [Bartonella tamiae]EJF90780.1 DNA mismatch repair protein MutL [Bartonella tamiae Th239]EJF93403.1 DNA mismatch repair protein MutL [Bartonella tamiae Th307]